jgi:hypothetical protein
LEKSNVIAQNKRVLRHRDKSPLGDFYTDKARVLADLIKTMELMNALFAKTKYCCSKYKEENLAFLLGL